MQMQYYVGQRGSLQVAGETRNPGDPCPEAASWPNLAIYVQGGYIVGFPVGSAPVVVVAAASPVPTPPAAGTAPEGKGEIDGAELPASLDKLTVAQAEPLILSTDDLETLEAWLSAEQAGQNRRGIVVPLTTKLDDLTKPQE